jgi:hypothetical protein
MPLASKYRNSLAFLGRGLWLPGASTGAAVALRPKLPNAKNEGANNRRDGLGRRILDFVTAELELVKS